MNCFKTLICIICCFPTICIANPTTDTVFYNDKWEKQSSRGGAAFYGFREKNGDGYNARDYYMTGILQMEGSYLSLDPDSMHGYFKYYDSVGALVDEGEYVHNKKEGKWVEYIPNTDKQGVVSYYKNGLLEGERYLYDKNGLIRTKELFVKGKKQGKRLTYFPNSVNIRIEAAYQNDTLNGLMRMYDSVTNNKRSEVMFRNGEKNGTATFYDSLGLVSRSGDYVNDAREGTWTFYSKYNHKVDMVSYYKGDTAHGPNVLFYRSGNKMAEGERIGKSREGVWTQYYDETDKVKAVKNFRNNKMQGNCKYYDSVTTKLRSEGVFEEDKKNGKWTYYFDGTDKTRTVEYYKAGKLDGVATGYFLSGRTRRVQRFSDGTTVDTGTIYFANGTVRSVELFNNGAESAMVINDSASGMLKAKGKRVNGEKEGIWEFYYRGTTVLKAKEGYKKGLNDGIYLTFYEDGRKRIVGAYAKDQKAGQWQYYYNSGEEWMTIPYHNGTKDGDLVSYHQNGKVKRREKHVSGTLVEMECFNEFGEEVPYKPLYSDPEFAGDVATFIGNELGYPDAALEARIEGKVVVEFFVNEDGSLSDIAIKRGLSPECDEEAIRVVSMMDKWKAASFDELPVKEKVSVPVVFWIREDMK